MNNGNISPISSANSVLNETMLVPYFIKDQIEEASSYAVQQLRHFFDLNPDAVFAKDENGRPLVFYIERTLPLDAQMPYYQTFTGNKRFTFRVQDEQGNTVLDRLIVSYIMAMQDNPLKYTLDDFDQAPLIYDLVELFAKRGAHTNHLLHPMAVLIRAQQEGRLHPDFLQMSMVLFGILDHFKTEDPNAPSNNTNNNTNNNPLRRIGNLFQNNNSPLPPGQNNNSALTANLRTNWRGSPRRISQNRPAAYPPFSLMEGLSRNNEVPRSPQIQPENFIEGRPQVFAVRRGRLNPTALNNTPESSNLLSANLGNYNKNNNIESRFRRAAFNAARTARTRPNRNAVDPGTIPSARRRRNRKSRKKVI